MLSNNRPPLARRRFRRINVLNLKSQPSIAEEINWCQEKLDQVSCGILVLVNEFKENLKTRSCFDLGNNQGKASRQIDDKKSIIELLSIDLEHLEHQKEVFANSDDLKVAWNNYHNITIRKPFDLRPKSPSFSLQNLTRDIEILCNASEAGFIDEIPWWQRLYNFVLETMENCVAVIENDIVEEFRLADMNDSDSQGSNAFHSLYYSDHSDCSSGQLCVLAAHSDKRFKDYTNFYENNLHSVERLSVIIKRYKSNSFYDLLQVIMCRNYFLYQSLVEQLESIFFYMICTRPETNSFRKTLIQFYKDRIFGRFQELISVELECLLHIKRRLVVEFSQAVHLFYMFYYNIFRPIFDSEATKSYLLQHNAFINCLSTYNMLLTNDHKVKNSVNIYNWTIIVESWTLANIDVDHWLKNWINIFSYLRFDAFLAANNNLEKDVDELLIRNQFQELVTLCMNYKYYKQVFTKYAFKQCDPCKVLEKQYFKFIERESSHLISKSSKSDCITNIYQILENIKVYAQEYFFKLESIAQMGEKGFESAINKDFYVVSESLAFYFDRILKLSKIDISNSLVDDKLIKAIQVLQYLNGKEKFLILYKEYLMTRLLLKKSRSLIIEKAAIEMIRKECGILNTETLLDLISDVELSKEVMLIYNKSKKSVGFEATLLSERHWPQYLEISSNLNKRLLDDITQFTRFYNNRHKNLKLSWRHKLSHCVIWATYPRAKKELVLNLFQGLILLEFNTCNELTFKELIERTGLPQDELEQQIKSLVTKEIPLLKMHKERNTKRFIYNEDFTSLKYRIKVHSLRKREKELKINYDTEKRDRSYEIEAAIVRLLKKSKYLKETDVLYQVDSTFMGSINKNEIIQALTKLLSKEYITRENDGYKYAP